MASQQWDETPVEGEFTSLLGDSEGLFALDSNEDDLLGPETESVSISQPAPSQSHSQPEPQPQSQPEQQLENIDPELAITSLPTPTSQVLIDTYCGDSVGPCPEAQGTIQQVNILDTIQESNQETTIPETTQGTAQELNTGVTQVEATELPALLFDSWAPPWGLGLDTFDPNFDIQSGLVTEPPILREDIFFYPDTELYIDKALFRVNASYHPPDNTHWLNGQRIQPLVMPTMVPQSDYSNTDGITGQPVAYPDPSDAQLPIFDTYEYHQEADTTAAQEYVNVEYQPIHDVEDVHVENMRNEWLQESQQYETRVQNPTQDSAHRARRTVEDVHVENMINEWLQESQQHETRVQSPTEEPANRSRRTSLIVNTRRNGRGSRRQATCEAAVKADRVYKKPNPHPPAWGPLKKGKPAFDYNSDGELTFDRKYTAQEIRHYFDHCPRRLILWVQQSPPQLRKRLGEERNKCCWECCPMEGKINAGWLRVGFDEYPDMTADGQKDPFKVAGQMHLACYEHCFDPVVDYQAGRLQGDVRRLPIEDRNPMQLNKVSCTNIMEEAFDKWFRQNQQPRNSRRRYRDTLSYELNDYHLRTQPKTRQRKRDERKGKQPTGHKSMTIDVHMGDVFLAVREGASGPNKWCREPMVYPPENDFQVRSLATEVPENGFQARSRVGPEFPGAHYPLAPAPLGRETRSRLAPEVPGAPGAHYPPAPAPLGRAKRVRPPEDVSEYIVGERSSKQLRGSKP